MIPASPGLRQALGARCHPGRHGGVDPAGGNRGVIAIDTNVLVRFLEDDPEQTERAKALLQKAIESDTPCYLSDVVWAWGPEPLQLVEVGVVVDETEPVVLGTGGDHEVGGGNRNALATRELGELSGKSPDLRGRGHGLEVLFHVTEQPLVPAVPRTVPQLEAHHVTEHRPIVGRDAADLGPNRRVAARPKRLDPGRGVDEGATPWVGGSYPDFRRSYPAGRGAYPDF
jgi:hypothetical protein